MKNNKEKTYRMESEIELAFPYLDELDDQINKLRDLAFFVKLKDAIISSRTSRKVKLAKKYSIKSQNHQKDGYRFQVKIEGLYVNSKNDEPIYYLVYANIKYQMNQKYKQFYKEFRKKNQAFKYYNQLNNELELLKRRDIMEKIFNAKEKEIRKLLWNLPFSFFEFISYISKQKD